MLIAGYGASLVMGVTLGLMGGGGSILTVPILVYLFKLPPTLATGASLFVVGLTALVGSVSYLKKGDVDLKRGLVFALPSLVGVFISRSWILPSLPDDMAQMGGIRLTKDLLIMLAFAVLMVAASRSMLRGGTGLAARAEARWPKLAALGAVVGLTVGFVGAGGGFLIVPALVVLAGLGMRVAVGTSLVIIAIQSLVGFGGDVARGVPMPWALLAGVSLAAACGIVLGSNLSHLVRESALKRAFGVFVLVMGLAIISEQLRNIFT